MQCFIGRPEFRAESQEGAAVSHIPHFGDAAASPARDAVSPAGDAATCVEDVHLPA